MRILTWNVNGIKTLLGYAPWNEARTYEKILTDLDADITCFQETKITPAHIDRNMACLDHYDAFFSSFRRKREGQGIHGTCIYTKRSSVIPVKAEEGLSSTLLPLDTPTTDRIGGYPSITDTNLTLSDMKDIDLEGRTTIVDCGLFVVITVYCPNAGEQEARHEFKAKFNVMLEERARALIRMGRQVIILGDINVTHSMVGEDKLTHAEPSLFKDWLSKLIAPEEKGGIFIDITRRLHPTREKMFTYWETKIDARATNMGCRIDYILITPGLLPWVKYSDIMKDVKGSDHCPVYLDLHDKIEIEGRGTVSLWEEMNAGRDRGGNPPPPPFFAIRNRDDFSGKQKTLTSYFGAKPTSSSASSAIASSSKLPASPALPTISQSQSTQELSSAVVSSSESTSALSTIIPAKRLSERSIGDSLAVMAARPTSDVTASSLPLVSSSAKGKAKAKEKGQQSLSFFKPAPEPKRKTSKSKSVSTTSSNRTTIDSASRPLSPPVAETSISFSQQDFTTGDYAACATNTATARSTWDSIFAAKEVPLCEDHQEPAKLYTVNKSGSNKNRLFYLCSRDVGEGYDKGQPKLHVNKEFRCNFFLWDSDIKRKASPIPSSSSKRAKTS